MSENQVDKTGQAATDAAAVDPFAQQVAPPQSQKPSPVMWLGLGGLLIVALLVIFVLPSVVTEYELPLERRVEVASNPTPVREAPAEEISPFEEAQRSIQRKEAQDILAVLLEIQAELDALEVSEWGQESYDAALAVAAIGDEYYRTQDFLLASDHYARGRDSLAELLETTPNVLQQILIEGENALSADDSSLAQDKFSLALVLDANSADAQIGLERAQALDEVAALFSEAAELLDDGDLEAAREAFVRITELDSYNELAPQKISEVDALIIENQFARIMSEGYALLQSGEPDQAIATFQRAASLGINQQEARAAIEQTETEVANAQINGLRAEIDAAESSENWAAAVTAYDAVLAIDPNLTFAIQGRDNADTRAALDAFLVNAINNPERLSEDEVYNETAGYYFAARDSIANPGPLLTSQLDELQALLEYSQVPLEVDLASDLLTDVTLLRVGNLGVFEQQTLALKPGRYVAVGRRPGFRDVREEFTVGFGQTPEQVVVRCVERVVTTSGR